MIIDSHCHAGINWFEPVEVLFAQMQANGVSGAVLVQHAGSYDNDYLFDCARRFHGQFKVVVQIDPLDREPERTLEMLAKQGAAGVRLYPDSRFRTSNPLAIWKLAGELGLVGSTGGAAGCAEFGAAFKKILDACPKTQLCLEHLCGAKFEEPPYTAFREALECAKWPQTTVKVPGLGEIVRRPKRLRAYFRFDDIPPLFEMAKEAFGVQRMLWGSDFPPSAMREGYRHTLEGVRSHPAFRDNEALEWVLGRSAARLWRFDSPFGHS